MKKHYTTLFTLLFCAYCLVAGAQAQSLVINEVMSSNTRTITDEDESYEDWIELYNASDATIDLTGYFLSDDLSNPQQWQFPEASIAPRSFLLVWASDKAGTTTELRASFKIGKGGEALVLSNADGEVIDQSEAVALTDDQVLARIPDGGAEWQVSTIPTPGSANLTSGSLRGVARVNINTAGVPIVDKETKVEATMELLNGKNSNYSEAHLYQGKIGIRGRGNTSWYMPKKPFSIELWDDNNEGIAASLFDMPAGEDWALIANYSDKSLMRNFIAYEFSRKLGRYAPRAQFADLYLNEEYQGNYLLVERIKRGDDRVKIKKLSDDESHQVEPNITGGYILELIPESRITEKNSFVTPLLEREEKIFVFKYPTEDNVTAAQVSWISNYINEFETVLYGANFADPVEGYAKYIDVDSFIDYIIVNELAKNNDANMHASVFLFKDRNEKLNLGPVWDFDIGFGNIDYNNNWETAGWYITESIWLKRLFEDKNFANRFVARMQEARPLIEALPARIDETAAMLEESAARNFEKWDILGKYVWPNYAPYPKSHQGEVDRLKEWIVGRTEWIYDNLASLQQMDYPEPYVLVCEDYTFEEWAADSEAGTYPANIILQQTQQQDPELLTEMDASWNLPYNLTSRSRINGIGEQGISFVNTGNAQDTPEAGYVGAALLSLNTMGLSEVAISWTGGTISPNNRHYGLRMQYRIGTSGSFADVTDTDGEPVEYVRNATAGHSQRFEDISLPADAGNEPIVQVRWKYYYIPTTATGSRAELRLDDISVTGTALISAVTSSAICDGEPATLTISALQGSTYQWMHSGEEIEGATSNTLQASTVGEYTVKVSTSETCSYTSAPYIIEAAEAPARPSITESEVNVLAVTPVLENATYIWKKDGQTLEQNAATIEHEGSGNYSVQVITEAGCYSDESESYTFTVTSVANEVAKNTLTVYPNPSYGEVNITSNRMFEKVTVSVVDLTGREVYKQIFTQPSDSYSLDLSTKSKGVYLLKVISDKQQLTKKIVLQ